MAHPQKTWATSTLDADEIKADIEEDIRSVKKDLKDYISEVFDLKRELESLEASLDCDHVWVRKTTKMYQSDVCSKCGYEKDI